MAKFNAKENDPERYARVKEEQANCAVQSVHESIENGKKKLRKKLEKFLNLP